MQSYENVISTRQEKLTQLLNNHDLNAILLMPGPNMVYFTGLHFHLSERPIVVILSKIQPPIFILPVLEQGKLEKIAQEHLAYTYGEDPDTWNGVFEKGIKRLIGQSKSPVFGIEPRVMRYLEIDIIQSIFPGVKFKSSDELISSLRAIKDDFEIESMRNSSRVAIAAFNNTLPKIKIGISEREIASELSYQIFREGSDSSFPFSPIVSGGPNAANPHAAPTDRRIQAGDLLVIDWGAAYHGYVSDITRTLAVEQIDSQLLNIYNIVKHANQLGREAVGPGVPAGNIDNAARAFIEGQGFGQYFFHRTGHGIGLESHEAPYIRAGNQSPVQPGMTFTVEPGIYLPGQGGVRIEDDVMVTEISSETITSLPRELITIG